MTGNSRNRRWRITGPVCAVFWLAAFLAPVDLLTRAVVTAADDEPAAETKGDAKASEKKSSASEPARGEKKDEQPKEAEAPKEKEKARNPLTEMIKRGFRPGSGKAAEQRPAVQMPDMPAAPANQKRPDRHASDPRAPYDRQASEWMNKAQSHAKAGEWKDALEFLQRITDRTEDSLYRTEQGKWVSIRSEADRLRGEAPAEILSDYRKQFGGLARQLLADASRTADLAAFGRVAKGYFHTEAGYEAANRLGSLHLDRGEFALSARWFAQLWQAGTPITKDSLWRAKAAYALKQAGQTDLSGRVLDAAEESSHRPVELGGASHDPTKWLAAAASARDAARDAPLTDWLMLYGTPSRTGTATGGEPLLLPRWQQPLTVSHPVQSQIEFLAEDLADQGAAPLPVMFPTMVGGKIAYRTLRGVQVVDAATGKPLWHTDEVQPIERLISGGAASSYETDGMMFGGPAVRFQPMLNGNMFYGGAGDASPLCNLLYRNANFGLLSSDGRQLFVVEDPTFFTTLQPGQQTGWDGSMATQAIACRLISYNLETGRPLWEAGGPINGEAFDPPLAGHFLFGAPLVDGGELFIVGEATSGERDDQIRLFALDPRTGAERWSQLIGCSEAAIEKDTGRRWWTAQVAAGDGILVCPTTVGWLVAVDRVTHSLLWGFRVPQTGQRNVGAFGEMHEMAAMVQHTGLANAWSASPPVIAEGRILYAPPEAQTLFCLDLFTGKEVWTKSRGHGMYLAGVFDKMVLVVGRDGVNAYDLETGAPKWSVKTSIPAGRGVAVADRYYLPMATGEVWSLDCKTGNVLTKAWLPPQVGSIGNLAMYRGMLLSLDVFGLTAFEQRDAVRDEIARRKAADARDAWALVREAEISALGRDFSSAVTALRQVDVSTLPGELKERYRSIMIDALSAVIRSDLARSETDADVAELTRVIQTEPERQRLQRLRAELFVARKQFVPAFDAYLALAEGDSAALISRDDDSQTTVRADLWVAGKLIDLMRALPDDVRAEIDRRVAERARKALDGTAETQRRFVTLFHDHPAAHAVFERLAEGALAGRDFAAAEQYLVAMSRSSDPARAASATERLAGLMRDFDLPADAALYFRELEHRYGAITLPTGKTGAQVVQALREAGRFPVAAPPVLEWQADALRVERMGTNYTNYIPQELQALGSSSPWFQQHRLDIEPSTQRLEVIDSLTDDIEWSLPLRASSGTGEGGSVFGRASGHRLTLLHRGVIHHLSPVERKIIWTRPIESRIAQQAYYYGRIQNPIQPMQQTANLSNRLAAAQNMGAASNLLAIANNEYICSQGRRSVTILDAATGEVRWSISGVRPGTLILGGEEIIYLRPPDGSKGPVALRALDGRRVEIAGLAETMARAVQPVGDNFVMTGAGGQNVLRLFDPRAQKDVWSVPLARNTKMSPLDDDRMALLAPDGKFDLLDLHTGEVRNLGALTAEELKGRTEEYALADGLNVYLIINKGANQNFYSEQVPFIRASGLIVAFDPEARKLRWKLPVSAQNLMLERLDYSPILVFASRKYEPKGKSHVWSLHLVAVDKLTGKKLLDEKSASQPSFRSVTVNAADRYVELRGYNERVRLYPVERAAEAGQSGG